jgi:hypothetical protein
VDFLRPKPALFITKPTIAPIATTTNPAIATGTFAMGIAMPAMTEPTITIIVVAQAAGVLPWLLMLDILAPFNFHTLIVRALLQSLSRNLTRNFTAPNPQLGLHLYQARAMDHLPAHIEMAIPHAWLPGGQTTGEVLALRP